MVDGFISLQPAEKEAHVDTAVPGRIKAQAGREMERRLSSPGLPGGRQAKCLKTCLKLFYKRIVSQGFICYTMA